jgi:hypothetical protein
MSIAKKNIDLQMIQSFNAFPCESQMQNDTYPMEACTSIDALNPKRSHVPLLVAPIPV